jgi:hypothetical protein
MGDISAGYSQAAPVTPKDSVPPMPLPDSDEAHKARVAFIRSSSVLPTSFIRVPNSEQPSPDSLAPLSEDVFPWFRTPTPSKFFDRARFTPDLSVALVSHSFTDPDVDDASRAAIGTIWNLAVTALELPPTFCTTLVARFNQLFCWRNIIVNAIAAEDAALALIVEAAVQEEISLQANLKKYQVEREANLQALERARQGEITASQIQLNQFMATSLIAEKSETLAREQRKDPYTSCQIRNCIFHAGAIGFAIHPSSGVCSSPPLLEVLLDRLSLLRCDGATPSKDTIMKLVSFSSAPALIAFHPLAKSNPLIAGPIALTNIENHLSAIHGVVAFKSNFDSFVKIAQRVATTAINHDAFAIWLQKALDMWFYAFRLWFSQYGTLHFASEGDLNIGAYINRVAPRLGDPRSFEDKDELDAFRTRIASGMKRPAPHVPTSPLKLPIVKKPRLGINEKLVALNALKPPGFYSFDFSLLPVDGDGLKVCSLHATGRPCTKNPCKFSHKILMSPEQMDVARVKK